MSSKSKSHRSSKKGYMSSISSGSYSASDSDLSSSSGSSSYRHSMDSAQRPVVSVEVLRCLRCARTVEATSTDDVSSSGMVRVGHNIYYCHRCAKLVGYTGRIVAARRKQERWKRGNTTSTFRIAQRRTEEERIQMEGIPPPPQKIQKPTRSSEGSTHPAQQSPLARALVAPIRTLTTAEKRSQHSWIVGQVPIPSLHGRVQFGGSLSGLSESPAGSFREKVPTGCTGMAGKIGLAITQHIA